MVEIDIIKKHYKIGDYIQIEYGVSNMVVSGELIDYGKSSLVVRNDNGDPFSIGEEQLNNIKRLKKAKAESQTIFKIENDREENMQEEAEKEEEEKVQEKEEKEQVEEKEEVEKEEVEKVQEVEEEEAEKEEVEKVQEKEEKEQEEEKEEVEKVQEDKDKYIIETPLGQIKVVGYMDLPGSKRERRLLKTKKAKAEDQEKSNNEYLNKIYLRSIKEKERKVNRLIQNGNINEALKKIEEILEDKDLPAKYISSFLLKKAQTYSSIRDYEKSKMAYMDLITFNEKNNKESKNLSHLYTELARLQSMNSLELSDAIVSARKALSYNKNNSVAKNLLEQLKSGMVGPKIPPSIEDSEEDMEFILDAEENTFIISKMIDIDIKEHKFTSEIILSNGGVPTANIAKKILEEAKATTNVDLSERYPVYLEAAKAYSELPIGSYDSQDYLESVAYYAILKGNSLFLNFKKLVLNGNKNIKELTLLKDSACSYYIESLNLLTNITGRHSLAILSNYLKMNIALCNIKNNEEVNFSGQFKKIFFNCLGSDNIEYNEIAWKVIIEVGSASANAWNKLWHVKEGIRDLYLFLSPDKRQKYYITINKLGSTNINIDLKPGEFLKQTFNYRKKRNSQFAKFCNRIILDNFDIHSIDSTRDLWVEIEQYDDLLSETDNESKSSTNNILQILSPYNKRNQIERTNILIQVQRILEKQISFIDENTTYYGRTLFFPLYNKWKSNIQKLLDKKIADTLPILQIYADPPYILKNIDNYFVNFIIKNVGESTAEGFEITQKMESLNDSDSYSKEINKNEEIPSGSTFNLTIEVPEMFHNEQTLKMNIEIIALYQGKKTENKQYSFTIEKEPSSSLKYEDIPWKYSAIPVEHMFKGRSGILNILINHYTSVEKDNSYILYGLTRTGKSSILNYLGKALDKSQFFSASQLLTIATFKWDLGIASNCGNAQELWQYLLYNQIYEELDKYIDNEEVEKLKFPIKPRSKDFGTILNFLKSHNFYPLFLVDEFSYIKLLMDNRIINSAFLQSLRQFAFEGKASFIFAGTYDIKALLKNPKYGITGQLVNIVEQPINEIDKDAAEELINVMNDKLQFTKEAISHIHNLTGDIPYFIQIICRSCGFYAVEKKRSIIGYPELEYIIKILTCEIEEEEDSKVHKLPENVFQNNMYSSADPNDVNVLISSIAYYNRNNIENPIGVSLAELEQLWSSKDIEGYRPKIAKAIEILKEKLVLKTYEDEGMTRYKIRVDLFTRWWWNNHQDFNREINTIL